MVAASGSAAGQGVKYRRQDDLVAANGRTRQSTGAPVQTLGKWMHCELITDDREYVQPGAGPAGHTWEKP